MKTFSQDFLYNFNIVLENINSTDIEFLISNLNHVRFMGGRLFVLGLGGSAANASHAVNDFRKITDIQAYCPSDNVSELTARANDIGWNYVFSSWLRDSDMNRKDALFVLSVGGGDSEKGISVNLINACQQAKNFGSQVFSIVGREGSEIESLSNVCIVIPSFFKEFITPIAESMQSVILHLIVSHPLLKKHNTTW